MPDYQKCHYCQNRNICQQEDLAWIFVGIGFLSTVAIRVVTILMNFGDFWGKLAWYIGVIGFIIFFFYKYRIFSLRAKTIENQNLLEKLNEPEKLNQKDYHAIALMLCKIKDHKERVNFFFIFAASFIALLLAIYFDFIV